MNKHLIEFWHKINITEAQNVMSGIKYIVIQEGNVTTSGGQGRKLGKV